MPTKKILPFSYLVLYSKGWIKCPWIKNRTTEEGYIEEVKTTYTTCQKKFNESFKDMLILKSYEDNWQMNYIKG